MLRAVLKSQYHASLAMLRGAIERCPPEESSSTNHKNKFWPVSSHALFFAHLYLQHDEAAFRLWEQHRGEGDGIAGEPYTQAQVLEYWEFCDRMIDDAVGSLDLDATESGFSWYRACPSWSISSSISDISKIMPRNRSTASARPRTSGFAGWPRAERLGESSNSLPIFCSTINNALQKVLARIDPP
jgi:hypothetical protein